MQEFDEDEGLTRSPYTVFLLLEEVFDSSNTIITLKTSNTGILTRMTSPILSERTATRSNYYWTRSKSIIDGDE
jgi:hypothetical protein